MFYASTGINPQSGRLANAPGSLVDQNGLNRNAYSNNGDGSRGGQAFNDQLYVGLANPTFGQLTFGRHKNLSIDMVGAYDPAGGSYAFSVIGYSGTPVAGLGDTGNGRWDDSFKYRLDYGPAHFGAIYKFADGNGGCNYTGALVAPKTTVQNCYATHNDAGQVGGRHHLRWLRFRRCPGLLPSGRFLRHPERRAGLRPRPGRQQHLHPDAGAAVTSIGVNTNTLAGNDFGQHRLCARRQIHLQPVEVLRRLGACDLSQPAG